MIRTNRITKQEQAIIAPIDREILEAELTKDKFVRNTNYGGRQIYVITHQNAPNILRELGRLREISFRKGGGGTGKEIDVDAYDLDPQNPFKQLIVWCPEDREIVGGYRFLEGYNIETNWHGKVKSPTSKLFDFSDRFIQDYLPYTIELGRSFIQPKYQFGAVSAKKSLYSLDNLWDGLGALIAEDDQIRYYFGKVTMYPRFNVQARDFILHFIRTYFPDNENLMTPICSVNNQVPQSEMEALFTGESYRQNYKFLTQKLRSYNESIPPLINAYMNLSPTMKSFGTAINKGFGNVEETGILITIEDIYDAKKNRHLSIHK
ncbi:MAG: GNAT family N-acetyltransferase [Saprospiraceae bacterium]|nr:GNAT family N-acetyltransferase [Saprospiraceae bacterium]